MAVVPAYFSPIAFPDVSMMERYLGAVWAHSLDQYKFKREQALRAMDPKIRALMQKQMQDSLDEALVLRTELIDNDRQRRNDLLKEHLADLNRNARQTQDNQRAVQVQKIQQRGLLRREAMQIQRENQKAFRTDSQTNKLISDSIDKFRSGNDVLDTQGWLAVFSQQGADAFNNRWEGARERYTSNLDKLSDLAGRGDARRREALFALMQENAIREGDVAGANYIASVALGRDDYRRARFQVGNEIKFAEQLTGDDFSRAQLRPTISLMQMYKQDYGPVTDSDVRRYSEEITRGGVGGIGQVDLQELLATAGLDKPLDLSAYDERINSLRKSLQRSRALGRQESAARAAIISGTAFSPYLGRVETPSQELSLIDQLGEIYSQSPAAGRRVVQEITTGNLEPGEPNRLVFDSWFQEASAARMRGLGEKESASLGGNVYGFFKKQLRSVARDAARARTAEDIVDLRERILYLSNNLDNGFVFRQLNQLETEAGTNIGSILKTGLRNITFDEPEDAEGIARFADTLADTIDKIEDRSTQSELAWLPYQYTDEIRELSGLYQQADKSTYKQRAVDLRNSIDMLDPDLAGNAGRTIVNQVDQALDTDNFDMFHSTVTDLNKSIEDWIVESQAQMAGVGE